jgi:hypothetical protein
VALINDTLEPSRVRSLDIEHKTTLRTWPNGRTTSKRNWATPLHHLEIEYEGITLTEYNLLKAFYNGEFGRHGVWTLRDNHDNTVYTVRFADDRLRRLNVRPNVKGLYVIRFRVIEDKA